MLFSALVLFLFLFIFITRRLNIKTTPGAHVKGASKLCSSTTNKTVNDGRKIYVREEPVPFVSMAEMLNKFQSSIRDISLPQQDATKILGSTRPREPVFETAQRARKASVKSSAELEEEMMAKMPKFKARLLNKKVFEGVEECPICYSVFHTTNHSLPRLACKTCKHIFHAACLYKWFSISLMSTCPLCQTPF